MISWCLSFAFLFSNGNSSIQIVSDNTNRSVCPAVCHFVHPSIQKDKLSTTCIHITGWHCFPNILALLLDLVDQIGLFVLGFSTCPLFLLPPCMLFLSEIMTLQVWYCKKKDWSFRLAIMPCYHQEGLILVVRFVVWWIAWAYSGS